MGDFEESFKRQILLTGLNTTDSALLHTDFGGQLRLTDFFALAQFVDGNGGVQFLHLNFNPFFELRVFHLFFDNSAEIQKGHHYYHCTKKKGLCQEKHYLREEVLTEQITSYLQKVSLSSQDTEKVLAELQKDEERAKVEAKTTVQNLKVELTETEAKLEKLLDAYLGEVISAEDYKARKESLITRKVELGEQIRDFEQKGLSWLEPAREFVLSLNKAANLIETENKEVMTTFLKTIGSNHVLENRQFVFAPKIQYELATERSEANLQNLQFPQWCPGVDLNRHGIAPTTPSR